ncbi:MAG: adenylate kinase [Candidatus Limnocylindria bacterium]
MDRIRVTGTSCSGKTTLSRAISDRLGLPVVELDALFWGPDWTPVPDEIFRARVAEAVAADRWVLDGGYAKVRELTWSRADTIVWLDYPMHIVLGRWARRTARRLRTREEFWPGTGNRERPGHVVRRDSLLWWILSTHRRRRRTTADELAARPHLRQVRLRSPAEAERWLQTLQPASSAATTAGAIASTQKP